MPNYRNIIAKSARVTIATSDGDLHVECYPSRVTQRMLIELDALSKLDETTDKAGKGFHDLNTLIIRLIKEWNLEDGDVSFPLDPDRMMELPLNLVQEVAQAIMGTANPNVVETQNGKYTS